MVHNHQQSFTVVMFMYLTLQILSWYQLAEREDRHFGFRSVLNSLQRTGEDDPPLILYSSDLSTLVYSFNSWLSWPLSGRFKIKKWTPKTAIDISGNLACKYVIKESKVAPSFSPRPSSSPSSGAGTGIVMRFKCSYGKTKTKKMDVPPLSTYKQRRPTSFNFSIKHFASFCNKYLYHVVFIINEKLQWLPQRFLTNFWESPAQMKSDSFMYSYIFWFLSFSFSVFYFSTLTLPF